MHSEKLWTKNYIAITAIFLLNSIVFFLLMSTVGMFVSEKFKVTESIAGLTASIFIISSSFSRLGTGRILSDKKGETVLFAGLVFCLAVTVFYFFVDNVVWLIIVRFMHGIGSGIATTAAATMIAYVIPAGRRAEGIGNFMSSGMLASAAGPFIGILLSQRGSLTTIYIICMILGVISLGVCFFIKMPEIIEEKKEIKSKKFVLNNIKLTEFFEKRALPISLLIFFTSLAYSSIMTYLPMYAKAIDMEKAASVYFIFHATAAIFTRPFMGRLMDRRGANIVTYPVLIIFSLGMLIVSRAQIPAVLFIGSSLIGFGLGNMNSIGQTIAIQNISNNRIGAATSTYYVSMDLGMGVGPYILGLMIPLISFRGIYVFASILLAFCIFVYYIVHGSKESKIKKLASGELES